MLIRSHECFNTSKGQGKRRSRKKAWKGDFFV